MCKKCKFPIERKCPRGHASRVFCFSSTEPILCSQSCDTVLSCGHACVGRCHDCHTTRVHASCKFTVKLQRFCGHTVTVNCTDLKEYPSHSSPNKCRMKCPHKKCSHNCSKSCEPCTEPCPWQCPHHRCEKCCHEICDRPPCNERCTKMLKCGEHQCFGLCGEPCLKVCPFCNKKRFRKKLKQARQFYERELHVQLDCGHIFTAEFMDNYISSKSTLATPVVPKECPECGQALMASFRYGTAVKYYILHVNAINVMIQIQHEKTLTEGNKLRLLRRLDDRSFFELKSTYFVELKMLLSTTGGSLISPQKAFLVELSVTFAKLLGAANKTYAPTAVVGECGIAKQQDYYLQRLIQEYGHCQLSHQLVQDLISEQYRLALIIQYSTSSSDAYTDTDLTPTRELLEELAKDSSRRLTADMYATHSKLCATSTGCHDYQLVHDSPVCLKGQWLSCSYEHYYSVPLNREPVREQICQHCSSSV